MLLMMIVMMAAGRTADGDAHVRQSCSEIFETDSFISWALKSESMQKSTKIADSWQGSKNQNRSSFADW